MIIVFVLWGGRGAFFGVIEIVLIFSSVMSVMGLEKSVMFSREGTGAIDGSFLQSDETLSSAGDKKLVSLGVDGNGGSGVLGVMDGKLARKTLLDKGGKSRS